MRKVWPILVNEYRSTVLTKAFIFAAFIFPVVFYSLLFIVPQVVRPETPTLRGTVAVYDATDSSGFTAEWIRREFDPATIEPIKAGLKEIEENEEKRQMVLDQARKAGGEMGALAMTLARRANPLLDQPTPQLEFEIHDDPQRADDRETLRAEMQERIRRGELIAFVEIGPGALAPLASGELTLYTPPDLHARHLAALQYGVRQGALHARLAFEGEDLVGTQLRVTPPSVETRNVTAEGDVRSRGEAMFLIPLAFLMLLWMSTFVGGQYLLMSTVEEKSSRVMEVLLSAVSPNQLMTGKILGQGAVALTMLAVYAGVGLAALGRFDMLYLVPPDRLVIFAPYFVMAFFFIAATMAAVGAVVNDIREANALMGPAMMVMVIPFLVMLPIIENPNSVLAVTLSFIPPLTPFIMAMRLGSAQAVPLWQVGATLAVGFAAVFLFVRAAAKIFRIGALLHGKPPNVRTMLRWAWAA